MILAGWKSFISAVIELSGTHLSRQAVYSQFQCQATKGKKSVFNVFE